MTNPYKKALGDRKSRSSKVQPQEQLVELTDEVLETLRVHKHEVSASNDVSTEPSAETEAIAPQPDSPAAPAIALEPVVTAQPNAPAPKKRGRPATGKRSADGWTGRTFYVKEETDLDVEEWLLKLKRRGVDIDKSELVEMLLAAWVKWQQGENLEIQLGEISPIQKDS